MLGFGSSKTRAHPHGHAAHAHSHASDFPKQSHRKNRIRGLKAAINNPRTTDDGRAGAQAELNHMGVRPTKPSLQTRIRHFLGMGGKSHRR
ncbi:uncharacterized protein MKK02DRAFT_42275 [Dioszegia hungarica]|uniref:Uncharacterized protein n=1 Tax=Dioszegia hungarica TaxID=4972 RepID=A0AA38HCS8_9TREE|nr:uncharacterized protein MKK02DRAFT_42275 [Dioszegia hungarica]KAI9637896.1 hypothetical protein MKK02DRAFT_42275 [Dioszegia hungarica]